MSRMKGNCVENPAARTGYLPFGHCAPSNLDRAVFVHFSSRLEISTQEIQEATSALIYQGSLPPRQYLERGHDLAAVLSSRGRTVSSIVAYRPHLEARSFRASISLVSLHFRVRESGSKSQLFIRIGLFVTTE